MQNSRIFPYYFAAALMVLAAGLIWLISAEKIARELMQILALIAGATFFSGLSLLLGQARQRSAPLIQINFNGRQLQEKLSQVIDAEYTNVVDNKDTFERETYADDDLVIALAKVRIDLERQIRTLARAAGILREGQRFDMRRSLDALEAAKKLPHVAAVAIRDILPICNRAIHGEEISSADARNVIDIAREVMVVLEAETNKVAVQY
jgi:hypothetical protein